jgi:non-specific serine/threonine protein kinase
LVELALCKATDGSLGLSRRQNEIANCLAHGLRDKEIAARLKISPSTVHTHVFRILRRWSVHKRTDVAKVILESRTS